MSACLVGVATLLDFSFSSVGMVILLLVVRIVCCDYD